MVAYLMNDEPLPLLNGYPIRLVVPGWYATYWVKMLKDIEVLDAPDDNFWTAKAYLVPDNAARECSSRPDRLQARTHQRHAAALFHHQHSRRRDNPARASPRSCAALRLAAPMASRKC